MAKTDASEAATLDEALNGLCRLGMTEVAEAAATMHRLVVSLPKVLGYGEILGVISRPSGVSRRYALSSVGGLNPARW